ncbi:MAG: carbohydrate ABC transporter permease [Candidatus Eisenbacteria bacterium]|uniref:Carbohydrate ABC transporter permease n=2 Tax=Eiseniibacteriota bacterium TaxID=2212470 RepID=A0A538T1J2_UNCEI|nr:MAG: carbohydrate ABC transporter permease [Candidatus Eisenbacteria bacterium]
MSRAAAALSVVALISLAPLLYMARVSLGVGNALPVAPADWWSGGFTLEHYRALGTSGGMGRFALNSLLVTGIAVPIQILLSAAAGHALARGRFAAKGVYLALATAFLILPRQVTLVPLYLLFSRLGLLDTYAGLILPHLADPFGVLFMAHLSGPGLAVVGVNGFLITWNAFLHPLVLTTSESMRTLPVGLALFAQSEHSVDWGALLAGSTIATAPVLIAFALFQRQIVEGLLQGSGR